MSIRRLAPIVLSLGILLSLAGCAAEAEPGAVEPTATASTESGPSATPSAPTPAPAEASVVTCESLLEPASLAEFAASTFGLPDQAGIDWYVNKTRDEGSALALFVDNGGVLCPVSNGMRVSEIYGFSPIDAEQASVQKAALVADGFIASPSGDGELYSDTADREGAIFVYLFTDGHWFAAYDTVRLDEIVANSPLAG